MPTKNERLEMKIVDKIAELEQEKRIALYLVFRYPAYSDYSWQQFVSISRLIKLWKLMEGK